MTRLIMHYPVAGTRVLDLPERIRGEPITHDDDRVIRLVTRLGMTRREAAESAGVPIEAVDRIMRRHHQKRYTREAVERRAKCKLVRGVGRWPTRTQS